MAKKIHCHQCFQLTDFVANLAIFQTPLASFSKKRVQRQNQGQLEQTISSFQDSSVLPHEHEVLLTLLFSEWQRQQLMMLSVSEKKLFFCTIIVCFIFCLWRFCLNYKSGFQSREVIVIVSDCLNRLHFSHYFIIIPLSPTEKYINENSLIGNSAVLKQPECKYDTITVCHEYCFSSRLQLLSTESSWQK